MVVIEGRDTAVKLIMLQRFWRLLMKVENVKTLPGLDTSLIDSNLNPCYVLKQIQLHDSDVFFRCNSLIEKI